MYVLYASCCHVYYVYCVWPGVYLSMLLKPTIHGDSIPQLPCAFGTKLVMVLTKGDNSNWSQAFLSVLYYIQCTLPFQQDVNQTRDGPALQHMHDQVPVFSHLREALWHVCLFVYAHVRLRKVYAGVCLCITYHSSYAPFKCLLQRWVFDDFCFVCEF